MRARFIGIMILGPLLAAGQEFRNLNFELAEVSSSGPPPTNGQPLGITLALPYWQAAVVFDDPYSGVSQTGSLASVHYNGTKREKVSIGLFDALNMPNPTHLDPSTRVMFGQYTPFLECRLQGEEYGRVDLYQTGLVPEDAQSMQFLSSWASNGLIARRGDYWQWGAIGDGGTQLTVSIDGQSIGIHPLETHPDYVLSGMDVADFAGQVVELRFSVQWTGPGPVFLPGTTVAGSVTFDEISFSSLPIPEPSSLTGIGLALFFAAGMSRMRGGSDRSRRNRLRIQFCDRR